MCNLILNFHGNIPFQNKQIISSVHATSENVAF